MSRDQNTSEGRRENVLEEALRITGGDRADAYGDALADAERFAQIASAVTGGRYIAVKVRKKTRANRVSAIYILMDPKFVKADNMNRGNIAAAITAP